MRRAGLILALACLAALAVALPASAEEERRSGYYTIVDADTGQVIWRTGLVVYPGDEYLTSNNLRYRVTRMADDTGYAKFLGQEELAAVLPAEGNWLARLMDSVGGFLGLARKGGKKTGPVAIYHTHSDESYVPTDGTSSKRGLGGIYQVGRALSERLRRLGEPTVHSYASHNPHDGMAYERSRRTAVNLLKENPAALLDIHRDAAPRQEYADRVDNEGVTKVQIVLGRSNPNLKANEAFAKQVKAIVDRKYPGFIKGIHYGQGKYNQDLSPRALLLEFGAHTNARQSAERGAAIFAAAAQDVVATGARPGVGGAQNAGAWRAMLYVLGGILAVAVLFLLINAGSFSGAGRNLGRFFRREFASALGEKKRTRRKKQDEQDNQ